MFIYYKKKRDSCVLCNHNIPIVKQKKTLQLCDENGKRLDKYLEVSDEIYNKILEVVNDSKN